MRTKRNKEISITSWRTWIGIPLLGLILPGFLMTVIASESIVGMSENAHYSVFSIVISGGTGNMSGVLSTGEKTVEGTVSIMVDQPIITTETMSGGTTPSGGVYKINLGYWSNLLRTPGTPVVTATYDSYPDRVELAWSYDTNDPPGTGKHRIYRDYSSFPDYIYETPSGDLSYIDDAIPAGQQYEYLVRGSNRIQSATTYQPIEDAGVAFGKTSSNGSIGGFIKTNQNTPIPNVRVNAYNSAGTGPAWGQAVFLDGVDDVITIGDADAYELLDTTVHSASTLEFWFNPDASGLQTLISKGSKWELGLNVGSFNYVYFNMDDTPIFTSDDIESQAVSINQWNHIALVREANDLRLYINGWLATINEGSESIAVSQQPGTSDGVSLGDGADHNFFRGYMDEFRCWTTARDEMFFEPYSDINNNGVFDDSTDFYTDINGDGLWGASDSTAIKRDYDRLFDYKVEGEVSDSTLSACFHMDIGSGETLINSSNLDNNGTLTGGVSWTSTQAPVYPSAFTDADGGYTINNLNFENGRTFRVIPRKAFHEFDNPHQDVPLSVYTPANYTTHFRVVNMISISGYVTYDAAGTDGATCGEPNVEIWVDGANMGQRTDADGYYLLEVEPGRTVTIVPHKGGRDPGHFSPRTKTFFNVTSPQSKSFVDSKLRTLRGSVTGGACELPLGPAGIAEITLSAEDGCFSTYTMVDAAGNYAFENIAPMKYSLSVAMDTDVSNIPNLLEMDTYFQNNGASINIEASYSVIDSIWTTAEDTVNFNYRSPIELRTDGWTVNVMGDYGLEQNGFDTLDIYVFENYYGGECPVDSGVIYVKDWISDRYEVGDDVSGFSFSFAQDMEDLQAPSLRYALMPGLPRLTGDYKKNLELRATDPSGNNSTDSEVYRAVVLGQRPNKLNFATTAPEIPLLILRRPPGDGSEASFSESSSASTSFSMSIGGTAGYEASIKAHLGVKTEINVAPMGVGTSFEIETSHEMEAGFSITGSLTSGTEMQLTTTTSSEYTTGGEDLTGDQGTVFLGGAMNLLYGSTNILDLVRREDASYAYIVTTEVIFVPDGFETTYLYTRGYVENYLLPELEFLSETDSDLLRSIDRWTYILAYEDSLRWVTTMDDNFSFSGGGQSMTKTHESESSESLVFEETLEIDTYFAESMGLEVAGFGIEGASKVTVGLSLGASQGESQTNITTTSYTLMDDDDGDDYSVDVGSDPVFGTPVFNVVAGNSSCPYEEWMNEAGEVVTTPRDEPGLNWLSASTVVNVHPDGVAELKIGLSNQSSLQESRIYYLSYLTASNTNGAEILINGEHADESSAIPFELEYQGSDSALITVTRPEGSDAYEYEGLLIKFAPECESNYAGVTEGYTASFGVCFARPCTEAEVYQPVENWIVNTITGDTMTIVIQEYDLGQSYFDELLVQYSTVGDENWYAVDTLDADTLRHYDYLYSQLFWDVGLLPDGTYDIRLQSKCLDGLLNNLMEPVRGVLDRQIPEVLGLPEPIDGVLNFNDAIAVNFTEPINPVSVDPVNVTLYDNTAGVVITDFELSVSENRLVITPLVLNRFIENHNLTASVQGYEDLNGNPGDSLGWEFTVDCNPVAWSTPELEHIAFQGEPEPVILQLNNTGSIAQSFFFSGTPDQNGSPLPEWLTVYPEEGSLNPGGSFDITFHVAPDLNNGEYNVTIFAVTPEGYEPFNLHVVSMCPYPEWQVDFSEYEFSMNVTARLFFMNTPSEDAYDRVGAFVNDECRGWAPLQYVPEMGNYQAFMTVYSDQWSGETVEFHLWDRTRCSEYWEADSSIVFVDGEFTGSPTDPIILNATGTLGQTLDLNLGFTWISLNLEAEHMNIDSIFANLNPAPGNRIIGQTSYSQYSEPGGWVGVLEQLDHHSMYQLDWGMAEKLTHVGYPIFADTANIPVYSGWNWVSYLPKDNMNVNGALGSLTSTTDDLVKSQTEYAQYVEGIGWLGSLTRMYPGQGYKLESLEPGVLQYPVLAGNALMGNLVSSVLPDASTERRSMQNAIVAEDLPQTPWVFDNYSQFQHSMTITALLESDTIGVNNPDDAVAAFVGDEIRGLTRPVYVPELDAYRIFLTIHGEPNELIHLSLWDAEGDIVYKSNESWTFVPDLVVGKPLDPEFITRAALGIGDKGYIPDVFSLSENYPNPFNPRTTIGFGVPEDSHVRIRVFNIRGQEIRTLVNSDLTAGYRFVVWNSLNDNGIQMTSGVYLIVMESESFRQIRKVLILK